MTPRNTWTVVGATVAVLLVVGGLFWFQPWKLWVDTRVEEALPATAAALSAPTPPSSTPPVQVAALPETSGPTAPAAASVSSAPSSTVPTAASAREPAPEVSTTPSPEPTPVGPVVLRTGTLLSHEHETSGTVAVVQLPDGSRVLTLENLSTSDGPDVRVWLSSASVLPGEAGWYTFADAPHVDLGALKGNLGNQVYEIPADVDLAALPNVSLWCQRFSVSFGAAELSVSP